VKVRIPASRLLGKDWGRITGAVSGQLSQAVGSFVLQLIAARSLGASGLGTFALLYSVIVMTTALSNGLVGDSLVVLDRDERPIRAALQNWCLLTSFGASVVGAFCCVLSGLVSWEQGALFALATGTFMIESILRRLLMAVMRFWYLVVVDAVSATVSLAVLAVWHSVAPLTLDAMLIAWVAGQVLATLAAVLCLPSDERRLVSWRPSAMRQVAGFGMWRAAQQSLRPAMLTAARFLITLAAGRAAFGQLEAARVYMAPALLVIQGLGSYLFSSYALRRNARWARLIGRADRASSAMLLLALAMGAVGALVSPWVGRFVTGPGFSLVPLAVFGWAVYAASTAAVTPFANLAAVRGRQHVVMALRTADSVLSLGLLALVINVLGADVSWAPYVLALGSLIDGAVIRWLVLLPLRREEEGQEDAEGAESAPDPVADPAERSGVERRL
jgi:O-antigen/teichoic acid export membrane protein